MNCRFMQQSITSDINISFASNSINTLYIKFNAMITTIPSTNVKLLEVDSANNKVSIEFYNKNLVVNINGTTKQTVQRADIGLGTISFFVYINSNATKGIYNVYMNDTSIAANTGDILGGEIISTINLYPTETSINFFNFIASDTEIFLNEILSNFAFVSSSIVSNWTYSSTNKAYYTFTTGKTISGLLDIDSLVQSSGAGSSNLLQIASLRFGIQNIVTGNSNNSVNMQLSINNTIVDLGTQIIGSNTSLTFGSIYTANPVTNQRWTYTDLKNTRVIITSETMNGALYLLPNIEVDYYILTSNTTNDLASDITIINEYIYATPIIFGTYIPTNDINASITSDITLNNTGSISSDITSDLSAIGGLANDITADLFVELYVDIDADLTPIIKGATDITSDVTLEVLNITDLASDITVEHWTLTPVDITSDLYNQTYVVANIIGDVSLKIPISNIDITSNITIADYLNYDITSDLRFDAEIFKDITSDLIASIKIYSDIIGDTTPILMAYSDIISDMEPCVFISSDITSDLYLTPTGIKKSYVYVI